MKLVVSTRISGLERGSSCDVRDSANFWIILSLVTTLAIAMFLPLKFIHPVQMTLASYSLPITLLWISFAGWSAWVDFPQTQ